jgi:hypothetical protein
VSDEDITLKSADVLGTVYPVQEDDCNEPNLDLDVNTLDLSHLGEDQQTKLRDIFQLAFIQDHIGH